jgi:hypothetical protein
MAPAVQPHPEARPPGSEVLMAGKSVQERLQREVRAEARRTILREAVERFNHELMDDEERQLLLDRIKRLRQGKKA